MSEFNTTAGELGFSSQVLVIELGNTVRLTESLESPHEYNMIISGDSDKLPPGLLELRIDIERETPDGASNSLPHICGTVEADISSFDHLAAVWPSSVYQELRDTITDYSYDYQVLGHEPYALYVPLDGNHTARIAMQSQPRNVWVEIRLYHNAELPQDRIIPPAHIEKRYSISTLQALQDITTMTGLTAVALNKIFNPTSANHPTPFVLKPWWEDESEVDTTNTPMGILAVRASSAENQPPLEKKIEDDGRENAFNMLGGLTGPKKRLRMIGDAFRASEIAQHYGVTASPVLLHGPSGTGKSELVAALAEYTGAELTLVSSTKIISKWVGQSPQQMEEILNKAYETDHRVILFFDEFDSLAATDKSSDAYGDVQRILQQHITNELPKHPHVLLVAATNYDPDDIEPALIRSGRFEPLAVPKPTEIERADIWYTLLQKQRRDLGLSEEGIGNSIDATTSHSVIGPMLSFDCSELAKLTDEMTGADIQRMIQLGLRHCFTEHMRTGNQQTLTQDTLRLVVTNFGRY